MTRFTGANPYATGIGPVCVCTDDQETRSTRTRASHKIALETGRHRDPQKNRHAFNVLPGDGCAAISTERMCNIEPRARERGALRCYRFFHDAFRSASTLCPRSAAWRPFSRECITSSGSNHRFLYDQASPNPLPRIRDPAGAHRNSIRRRSRVGSRTPYGTQHHTPSTWLRGAPRPFAKSKAGTGMGGESVPNEALVRRAQTTVQVDLFRESRVDRRVRGPGRRSSRSKTTPRIASRQQHGFEKLPFQSRPCSHFAFRESRDEGGQLSAQNRGPQVSVTRP